MLPWIHWILQDTLDKESLAAIVSNFKNGGFVKRLVYLHVRGGGL